MRRVVSASVALGVLLTLSCRALAFNEPTGFRDIVWGESEKSAHAKLPRPYFGKVDQAFADRIYQAMCADQLKSLPWLPERECRAGVKIGSAEANVELRFREDKLVEVSLRFHSAFFDALQSAFTERYGKPTNVTDEHLKTQGGLEVINRILAWKGVKTWIFLRRYSDTIEYGSGEIVLAEEKARQLHLLEESQKAGAKDL